MTASFLSCSSCGCSLGTKWTLDDAGDVWEWCPLCSQQIELFAEEPVSSQVDKSVSVRASESSRGGLRHISEVKARQDPPDGLPF